MDSCFPLTKLGEDVANSLEIYAICRVNHIQIPQIIMFIPDFSSLDLHLEHFSVKRAHPYGNITCTL